jgi:hypothetical protein
LQEEEVEYVLLMSADEIFARSAEFTPDSLAAINLWLSETK